MKEQNIPVGIYEREIYIARIVDGEIKGFDVLRPVTADTLEQYREPSEIREYIREDWKEAVRCDRTEDSLDEYVDEVMSEYDLDEEEEMYPGKDESGLEFVTFEERDEADKFMEETYGHEIGTWECSGWYAPVSSWKGEQEFNGFDYIFNNSLARKWAKKYTDSVER